jgi:hypothetical protein
MSGLLDTLAYLAALCGGLWLWRQLRGVGLGRLAAAGVACLALWLLGSLVGFVWLAAAEAWFSFLASASPWLPAILWLGFAVGLVGVGWLAWRHWRARRFFGG